MDELYGVLVLSMSMGITRKLHLDHKAHAIFSETLPMETLEVIFKFMHFTVNKMSFWDIQNLLSSEPENYPW